MGRVNEVGQPLYLTRTPLPSVDWDTFFDAVEEAFNLHLTSAGPPGQKAPVFTAEYPKTTTGGFDNSFDVITYHITQSVRAATDPSGKRRFPKGPNLREIRPHPTKARYQLVTIGWWELMSVKFTIFGLSHSRADEVTKWFHKLMMRYTFDLSFFKARGVQYLTFEKRGSDEFSKEYGQELYIRTLEYNVRLELLETFEYKDLEAIHLTVGGPPNPEQEFDLVEKYITPSP